MKHWAYCRSNHGTESSVEREGGGQILPGQPNFNPSRHRATTRVRSTEDGAVRLVIAIVHERTEARPILRGSRID